MLLFIFSDSSGGAIQAVQIDTTLLWDGTVFANKKLCGGLSQSVGKLKCIWGVMCRDVALFKIRWSRMKWQSILICFVHSWRRGLAVMWRATLLPQAISIGRGCSIPCEQRRLLSQINSIVVSAMEWCSASAKDLLMVVCFFIFQDTGQLPSVMK